MTLDLPSHVPTLLLFAKCLESLLNLHTLEVELWDRRITTPLKNAFKHVRLPQIRTLILPIAAYPLLKHCGNVEDVILGRIHTSVPSKKFIGALASIRSSKVKRLAIPPDLWNESSRK